VLVAPVRVELLVGEMKRTLGHRIVNPGVRVPCDPGPCFDHPPLGARTRSPSGSSSRSSPCTRRSERRRHRRRRVEAPTPPSSTKARCGSVVTGQLGATRHRSPNAR
jgi:hypothetical protein